MLARKTFYINIFFKIYIKFICPENKKISPILLQADNVGDHTTYN